MADTFTTIQNTEVMLCALEGHKLDNESAAVDLIGEAFGAGVTWIVIPVERLTADFFQLKTRLAGEIVQKFLNYRQRLVILGDISPYEESSRSFRDFVYETNRGNQLWFLKDMTELSERLSQAE